MRERMRETISSSTRGRRRTVLLAALDDAFDSADFPFAHGRVVPRLVVDLTTPDGRQLDVTRRRLDAGARRTSWPLDSAHGRRETGGGTRGWPGRRPRATETSRDGPDRPPDTSSRLPPVTLVDDGWRHFADADWQAAHDTFAAALAEPPGDPDALDGLGQALWWLGERDAASTGDARRTLAYRGRGDTRRAGRIATYLAGEERIDGRSRDGAGWLARARRLLAGAGVLPEHGWLEIEEAKSRARPGGDRGARARRARVAHEIGDPDIECMALGAARPGRRRQGRVDEGVASSTRR